jgi:antitoxin Phd
MPMETSVWQLQDAKARLSEVVEAATRGHPQRVTRRGKDAVVIVSAKQFDAMSLSAKGGSDSFIAHLLAMPREPKVRSEMKLSSKPSALKLRDIKF